MDHVYRGEEKDGKIGMQKENSYNFLSETLTDTASVRGLSFSCNSLQPTTTMLIQLLSKNNI